MNKEKKLSKKKLRELMLEESYTIEALEDEIENLVEEAAENHSKLWEIIKENDRLTLKYEPFRPPGDEHEDLDFYGLIEERDHLREELILQSQKNYQLTVELRDIRETVTEMKPSRKRIKNDRWWNFSVELWPGSWDLNYYRYDWRKHNGTSREGQMQIGPFGFSWSREPKRD